MDSPFLRSASSFLHSIGAYAVTTILVLFAGLTAWATWGSPTTLSLTSVAAVGTGLILAVAMAVRGRRATHSVAHIL